MSGRARAPFFITGSDTSIIEDTYLLAALLTFDPTISYQPLKDRSGYIAFEVKGRIADAMGRFYANESTPLGQYITNLKRLRATIFALKGGPPAGEFLRTGSEG